MAEIEIISLDPLTASDEELTAVHDLRALVHAEALPHDPYQPLALSLVEYRRYAPDEQRRWWVARQGGRVVGHANTSWEDLPENRNHASVNVFVAPVARRAGLGSALFRLGLEAAEEWGADLIDLWARVGGPADGFLRALGAELCSLIRYSTCPTAGLDVAMLEGWVRRAKERAPDYSLIGWDGACPDEHIESFCQLNTVMNTAPRDDADFDDFVLTPALLRSYEAVWAERGYERWTLCARHDGSGELAGFTEMVLPRLWPEVADQEDTGVWPKHRERGLGRWLKAAMALRLLAERPAVERIETSNAESNQAMLSINVAMGFVPKQNWAVWQVPRDRAARAVR